VHNQNYVLISCNLCYYQDSTVKERLHHGLPKFKTYVE